MALVPRNELERKVLEMVRNGQRLAGWAFDIWMDMTLDAEDKAIEEKEG